MPAAEHLLDIMLGELKRVLPRATWTGAAEAVARHGRRPATPEEARGLLELQSAAGASLG